MEYMEVELIRIFNCPTYCIGKLYINGVYQNDTLEDTDRGLDQSMTEAFQSTHPGGVRHKAA